MEEKLYSFEKLVVWQKAKILAASIYKCTATFPVEERYGMISQMKRSAISIASNIAEGSGRSTGKDKAHFSTQAYSSLLELLNLVILSVDLGYLEKETSYKLRDEINDISRLLSGLRNAQLKSN